MEVAGMSLARGKLLLRTIAALIVVIGAQLWLGAASADTIAVIGTGHVGGALGPQFAKLGHRVIYGSREPQRQDVQALVARTAGDAAAMLPAEAAGEADIVVVAVPWSAAEQVVKGLGDLSGKIIIDPTNATRQGADGYREHAVETSAGQMIQGWAPQAKVVKAFNTLNYRTMAEPSLAGGPVTIPIAGNDADAKAAVADLAKGIGFDAVDVGPIRFAKVLEEMLIIWVNARSAGMPYNYYFRPVPAN
jgi:predicted dinucleotide-binding enzyme